jgi:hypothetical protein
MGGHEKGPLTVQPGPAPVALVQDVGSSHGHTLGLPHLVRVKLAVRAQKEGVVHLFGGSGVVQPLLQPLQGDKLVRLAYEVGGEGSFLSTATQSDSPSRGLNQNTSTTTTTVNTGMKVDQPIRLRVITLHCMCGMRNINELK